MRISIASGKGGTGKTTLALLLAATHRNITLIDCDVEEPNCHLFLKPQWQDAAQNVTVMVPYIDSDRCIGCGTCADICLFNAIAVTGEKALLFDELCHSCGGCILACQYGAIKEGQKQIGVITTGISTSIPGVRLMSGTLDVGVPSGVPLIRALKKEAQSITGDVIFDCPPGTACSMVNAVNDSDFCLLVTEPTPFGRHDLELAINIARLLQIPAGVIINKSDASAGDQSIADLCHNHQIPVLAKIPHSRSLAGQYAAGIIPDEFRDIASHIWHQLDQRRSAET